MQGEILKQRIGSDGSDAIITGLASPVDVAIDPSSGRPLAHLTFDHLHVIERECIYIYVIIYDQIICAHDEHVDAKKQAAHRHLGMHISSYLYERPL